MKISNGGVQGRTCCCIHQGPISQPLHIIYIVYEKTLLHELGKIVGKILFYKFTVVCCRQMISKMKKSGSTPLIYLDG